MENKNNQVLPVDFSKEKHMDWCLEHVRMDDIDLDDVIMTDECSVQLEAHRKIMYHKQGEPSRIVSCSQGLCVGRNFIERSYCCSNLKWYSHSNTLN